MTIRHGGPSGLQTRMRSAERNENRGFFLEHCPIQPGTETEGGVFQESLKRCSNSILPYLSHSAVVARCESPPRVEREKKRGTRATPQKSGGGHVIPDSGAMFHASIRPHAGRSRPHLSLREGSEQPPRRGAERSETDL